MIEIRSLHKTFKGMQVLGGVDLDVPAGKITVILGPSGTGKSVLLKNILGLIKPDSGMIRINGQDICGMGEYQMNAVRQNFGVCFQDAALFDSMTVGDNVAFPFKVHTDMADDEIAVRVGELLREVGLAGIEDKLPSQISGGMRKRVGIARALALRPDFLFFDEPTTGLDPIMSNAINALIHDVQEHIGATALVISHDIKGAFDIADYIAMIYEGRIIMQGTPHDFINTKDPLVRQFIEGGIEGPINAIQ